MFTRHRGYDAFLPFLFNGRVNYKVTRNGVRTIFSRGWIREVRLQRFIDRFRFRFYQAISSIRFFMRFYRKKKKKNLVKFNAISI